VSATAIVGSISCFGVKAVSVKVTAHGAVD
jgi:hypothetical protein